MNTVYIDDENFINSTEYREFIQNNPARGFLKIRAYAASQAIPISGLKVIVSTNIGNYNVIFFDGYTNASGIIEGISLPAPELNLNNMDAPNKTTYDLSATYVPDNISQSYKVNMYENVAVIQNINIIPESNIRAGGI